MKVNYIFEAEIVAFKFEVDQCVVLVEAVNEHAADSFVKTVVAEVQAQQGGIGRQGVDHFFNTGVLLTVMREVVGLQVKELQRVVLAKGQREEPGGLEAETIAFELELAECFVAQEHTGKILTLLVFDPLTAEVKGLESVVMRDDLGQNLRAGSTQLHATDRVVMGSVLSLSLL